MINVVTAYVDGVDVYHAKQGEKGVYVHDTVTNLVGILDWNKKRYKFKFTRMAGYTGNFASSPNLKLVQKILPSSVDGDDLYNIAFDLHDWLYSVKGQVTKPLATFSRSEVDDFMRGVARESPTMKFSKWARFRCGVADLAVGLFAGGKSHWGNDTYFSMNKAILTMEEMR